MALESPKLQKQYRKTFMENFSMLFLPVKGFTSIFTVSNSLYFLNDNLTSKRMLQARIHSPVKLNQNQEEINKYSYNFKVH